MKSKKSLFQQKNTPLFRMILQTLIIFMLILLPLTINTTSSQPPYSISNTTFSGMSYFNGILMENGYNTTRTLLSSDPIKNLPDSSILVIAGGSKNYRDSEKLIIDSFVVRGGILFLLANEGPSYDLATYFGVYLTSSIILETQAEYWHNNPEIIKVNSSGELLCFVEAKSIVHVDENDLQEELFALYTHSTTIIDSNNDRMWNVIHEPRQSLKVGTGIRRGAGIIIVLTSSSFLTNDLYDQGYGNIDLTMYYLNSFASETEKQVCFEESHKRWPFTSTEGIINQSYGTIVLLSKTQLFVFLMVILILLLYYITPRFRDIFRSSEDYKEFISGKIWSRKRELYDTFGSPVKPTTEEQYLSNLYFQYELYPTQAYNYYIEEKLKYVPSDLISEEESELISKALTKKMDSKTFLSIFLRLEEIQKRGRLK